MMYILFTFFYFLSWSTWLNVLDVWSVTQMSLVQVMLWALQVAVVCCVLRQGSLSTCTNVLVHPAAIQYWLTLGVNLQ